jgi:hypothetical protein
LLGESVKFSISWKFVGIIAFGLLLTLQNSWAPIKNSYKLLISVADFLHILALLTATEFSKTNICSMGINSVNRWISFFKIFNEMINLLING